MYTKNPLKSYAEILARGRTGCCRVSLYRIGFVHYLASVVAIFKETGTSASDVTSDDDVEIAVAIYVEDNKCSISLNSDFNARTRQTKTPTNEYIYSAPAADSYATDLTTARTSELSMDMGYTLPLRRAKLPSTATLDGLATSS